MRSLDSRVSRLEGREPPPRRTDPLVSEAVALVMGRLERPACGFMNDPRCAALLIGTSLRMTAAIARGRGAKELARIRAEALEPDPALVAEIEALGGGGLKRYLLERTDA